MDKMQMFGLFFRTDVLNHYDDIRIEYTNVNGKVTRADIWWVDPLNWLKFLNYRVFTTRHIAYHDNGNIEYVFDRNKYKDKAPIEQIATLDSICQFWIENKSGVCSIELIFKDERPRVLISRGLTEERARSICYALEFARNFQAPTR